MRLSEKTTAFVICLILLGAGAVFLIGGARAAGYSGNGNSSGLANSDNKIHYEPTWESLSQHSTPEWFENAVLGIYFHWGVYSVPAYASEWYPHYMYITGAQYPPHGLDKTVYKYHCEHYGDPSEFGYKDFIPMWKGENWDPDRWAELFENAGADFAGSMGEHHDGFAMWDTEYDEYNSMDMGPHRDVVGEMFQAIREHTSMRTVTTFHHARNWWYYGPGREHPSFDVNDPEYSGLYTHHELGVSPPETYWDNWLVKPKEVIDKYQPSQIWFDFTLDRVPENYQKAFLAYYFNAAENWGKEVVVTRKQRDLPLSVSSLNIERGRLEEPNPQRWQTGTSVDYFSWGHIQHPSYKTVNTMVDRIVDRISKNGTTLLSIAPKADGTIPENQVEMLNKLGDWMDVNKPALYAAEPAPFVEGGVDTYEAGTIRFTRKGNYLYAIDLEKPEAGEVIPGVTPVEGSEIRMLGSSEDLDWHQKGDNVVIDELPDPLPCDYAWSFKILTESSAKFEFSDLSVSKAEVEPGENLTVSVLVTNTGGESGSYTAEVSIDDETRTEEVTLDPGASDTVSFDVSMEEEGTYTVSAGTMTQSFEVSAPKQPEGGGFPVVPVAGVVAVVIAAIGMLAYKRRG